MKHRLDQGSEIRCRRSDFCLPTSGLRLSIGVSSVFICGSIPTHKRFTNGLPATDNPSARRLHDANMTKRFCFSSFVAVLLFNASAAESPGTFARLPIKEVTVFK